MALAKIKHRIGIVLVAGTWIKNLGKKSFSFNIPKISVDPKFTTGFHEILINTLTISVVYVKQNITYASTYIKMQIAKKNQNTFEE
jgi:hypothetical protein